MPIFEYRCKHCKTLVVSLVAGWFVYDGDEELITTSKPPKTFQCKKCGNKMQRVQSVNANMASRWLV
jgi:predicted nucleic acid-binding Zn ribbon protein